ncbi:DUF2061 domain-containing protein [Woodsholea maritima]|uniref:DUF2061 domain-containing protein n=1 Tax=Woodsholea maritima TaxID=240237 RepID=UPI0003731C63|nr:DUF2061 domain-containing protein [Woodsholea maritima]
MHTYIKGKALFNPFGPRGLIFPRFSSLFLKTLSYSVMHLCVAMSVAWMLTGNLKAALAIGLIEPAVQTVAYTCHERIWARGNISNKSTHSI